MAVTKNYTIYTKILMKHTTFKIKFKTAVPPPNMTDKNALKELSTKLMFPLTINHTDSRSDIKVPMFCFTNSTKAVMLNNSATNVKHIKNNVYKLQLLFVPGDFFISSKNAFHEVSTAACVTFGP